MFDEANDYTAGDPVLTGSFIDPALVGGSGAPLATATSSSSTPLVLTFSSAAVPPAAAFSVLVNDTTTGGDWVRAGVLTALPPSPDLPTVITIDPQLLSSTDLAALTPGTLLAPTIVPGWLRWLSGILTAGVYIPLVAVMPAPTITLGTGSLSVTLTGSLAVRVGFFQVSTYSFTLTATITPAPSADTGVPSRVLSMTASAPTLTGAPAALGLTGLAPFLASTVASQLESLINTTIVSDGHAAAAAKGLQLTSTAIFSARRVTVLPSGINLQLVLADLWGPAVLPIPGTLAVSISPRPQAGVAHAYTVTVTNAATGMGAQASLTLHNYDVHGVAATTTAPTDPSGQHVFNVTLHSKVTTIEVTSTSVDRSGKPHVEPEKITKTFSPTLIVDAAGFNSVHLALL
ncbi:MAG TPA: hypothetical protein VFB02_05885 [Bradyrhizobium sp.]|nr:hypothetical protein [Bradyrhizobium sp.]